MKRLPTYEEIKKKYPLSTSQGKFIESSKRSIRHILNHIDRRLLLVVGPCSIHDPLSAKEFAAQIYQLSEKVNDQLFLAMRVYCEKPRTASGWKGYLYDPFLDGSQDIEKGIELTRQLMIELTDLQVPIATEFLDPLTAFYFDDLVSWGSIGARTTSSQIHRQFVSGLDIPIGFKNGVAGNISAAINGVVTSSIPHCHIALSDQGFPYVKMTLGNFDTHIVLRGGESGPNFSPKIVLETIESLENHGLAPRVMIDCSHHNSSKNHELQPAVFRNVINQLLDGNDKIRGIMMESHLKAGKQTLTTQNELLHHGISITDSCMDFETTQTLIWWAAQRLRENTSAITASFEKEKPKLGCCTAVL